MHHYASSIIQVQSPKRRRHSSDTLEADTLEAAELSGPGSDDGDGSTLAAAPPSEPVPNADVAETVADDVPVPDGRPDGPDASGKDSDTATGNIAPSAAPATPIPTPGTPAADATAGNRATKRVQWASSVVDNTTNKSKRARR